MRAQLLRSLGRLQPIRGRPAIQCGKRLRSNDGDVTIAIKAMRDITSGHLRSSGGTKHLCLGLLGTLWFTRGRLPQVQATLQSVSITLSYFFHLLGLFGPLQPERRHFPSVWGLLSVDSAAGLLRGGISSDQCHCGRPKTVVARHIHNRHQGKETCLLRAKNTVFWPKMTYDVQELIERCIIYQEHGKSQPIIGTIQELPPFPWHTLTTDMFYWKRMDFLISADVFSKYYLVKKLANSTLAAVCAELSMIVTELGLLHIIRSDNGPCYNSKEFQQFLQ